MTHLPTNAFRLLAIAAFALGPAALLPAEFLPAAHADDAWAYKMFDATSHDFGKVARGADVSHRFRIKNLYEQTVHISGVRTSCSCSTAGEPSRTTLRSLEEATIDVRMNTTRFKHEKTSNLIVTFDAPLYAEVKIPLKAYIRSDIVLTPGTVDFGSVDQGERATETIDVAYAGRDDWTLKEVKTGSEYLDAKVTELSRGNGRVNYRIDVTLAEDAPAGVLRKQITLVTDDVSPYVPMTVSGRVESEFTVATPSVALGSVPAGQEKPFSVVIRGKRPFEIEGVECESAQGAFKVRLPQSARPLHVIPLTFSAPNKPGGFSEEFTVTIAGREEPVHFTVSGQVVESSARSSSF